MNKSQSQFQSDQQGIALIEAMAALLILALGVLGLAEVQVRMLVETRTTNARATAIRLIADLGERIRLNPMGAQPCINPADPGMPLCTHPDFGLSPYSDARSDYFPVIDAQNNSVPAEGCNPAVAINARHACSPAGQASYDAWVWRQEVASSLPNGAASIWQVSPQQLRIIVAWQINENTNITLTGQQQKHIYQQLAAPLQITAADGVTNLCPTGADGSMEYICHVDFIGIPPVK